MKASSLKKKSDRQRGHSLDLWEVWHRNYRLPLLGAAKDNKTEIFVITIIIKQHGVLLLLSLINLCFSNI